MSIAQDLAQGRTRGTDTFSEKAVKLGPFKKKLSLNIVAKSHHKSTGDDSRARMFLYYDNAEVASHRDEKDFDNSYLETKYSLDMDAGNVAQFRVATSNEEADEMSYSFQVEWRADN